MDVDEMMPTDLVVLFTDIHEFSWVIKELGKSGRRGSQFIQEVYQETGEAVVQRGGEILQYHGDGILAVITWRGKATGTSPIALIHVLLAAPAGVEIPASAEDGRVVVASPEALPADTPETAETISPAPATADPARCKSGPRLQRKRR